MAKKIKSVEDKIRDFLEKHELCNFSQIAKATGLTNNTVADIIDNMEQRGEVIITNIGTANIVKKVEK